MEPARTIIERFGGVEKVSDITGTAYTAPYRWRQPKEKGGTDGIIPTKHALKLLDYARLHEIDVTADDFMPLQHLGDKADVAA